MMTTDEVGAVDQRVSYTAFGETVLSDGQGGEDVGGPLPAGLGRYGYAGGWGYETGGFDAAAGLLVLQGPNGDLPPVVLQHVGARWYDAGVGRFVQRDPIGVAGGLNPYLYCAGNPASHVDPTGTHVWIGWNGIHKYIVIGPLPDGSYVEIHFAVRYSFWDIAGQLILIGGRGDVSKVRCSPPVGPPHRRTTPTESQELVDWATSGSNWYHFAFNSCIGFSTRLARHNAPPPRPTRGGPFGIGQDGGGFTGKW